MDKVPRRRGSIYLTNAVKHFKWELCGKRRLHKTTAQKEIAACHLWLEAELARVRPDVVVAYHPSFALRARDEASRRQAYQVIVDGLRQALLLLDKVRVPSADLVQVIVDGLRQALLLLDKVR